MSRVHPALTLLSVQGLGTFYWPNGDVYEGEWRDGKRNGCVTPQTHVSSRVADSFVGGRWGTLTYVSGERYEGEWKDDERCGFGKYFYGT